MERTNGKPLTGLPAERIVSMEKVKETMGVVQIADDVVAMIAGLAAMEVDGVSGMAGHTGREFMKKGNIKNLAKNVRVEIEERVVSVEMSVHLKYGYNIPDTSKKIQEKVKSAIETMTGLTVSDVNVRIAGVDMA